MFLKKVTTIRSVGRFKAARIAGGNYDRFTLIYGGNGRGKSTLCAILRSLQTNDQISAESSSEFPWRV